MSFLDFSLRKQVVIQVKLFLNNISHEKAFAIQTKSVLFWFDITSDMGVLRHEIAWIRFKMSSSIDTKY